MGGATFEPAAYAKPEELAKEVIAAVVKDIPAVVVAAEDAVADQVKE
jgi:hypothetical protein